MRNFVFLFLILILSGCRLFSNEQNENVICDEQLFEEIRLMKSLPVSITYNIEYSDEQNLNEAEIQVQKEQIRDAYENF